MKRRSAKVVVVAESSELVRRVEQLFPGKRTEVSSDSSIDRVVERFESEVYDVVLITGGAFRAGEVDDVELLEVIAARSPATQVLFLVEQRDIKIAMSALKAGAYQYAKLPLTDEELRPLIKRALEKAKTEGGPPLREAAKDVGQLEEIVGRSQPMQDVYRQIRLAAVTDIPVLFLGETGTGKDLAARAIHQLSDRKGGPLVTVHLAALPGELVASELFGHEKGAFTGATSRREGRFEQARDGTVFLDEIGSVDEKVQVALLRLIEQKKFQRLGGRRTLSTNVRLITASNQNLAEAVDKGTFREDLYYRLDVFRIVLPPLRQRYGDIPLLFEEFLQRYSRSFGKNISGVSPECVSLLEAYDWPGNVRELKNVIQRAVLVCRDEVLRPEHLPQRFRTARPPRHTVTFELGTPLDEVERELVVRALAAADNNRTRAAGLLGISRRALYNKLRKHGIQ